MTVKSFTETNNVTEEKEFTVGLSVTVTGEYDYSDFEVSDTIYATGKYLVPSNLAPTCVDDLDDDRVEHLEGTDLVSWVSNASEMEVDVEVGGVRVL